MEEPLIDRRGVHIESSQAQRSTGAVNKGRKPTPTTQVLQRPLISDEGRRSTKGHHICQGVHLRTEFSLGVGHTRNPTVQAVQHNRTKNSYGRRLKVVVHGHHDGIKTAKQSSQGEEVGQYINALSQAATRLFVDEVL